MAMRVQGTGVRVSSTSPVVLEMRRRGSGEGECGSGAAVGDHEANVQDAADLPSGEVTLELVGWLTAFTAPVSPRLIDAAQIA